MADIKLFNYSNGVKELPSTSVSLEKELQNLIERNMENFFGVKFLESEYTITNGRIDSLGIDENNCPVIFEYKRSSSENVINQGLFYLDWLLDHKADFKIIVIDKLGLEVTNNIEWSVPCVICIANDFTKYDEHAVNQMQKNIKLVRYRKYEDNLILFEHINTPKVNIPKLNNFINDSIVKKSQSNDKTFFEERLNIASEEMQNIFTSISNYILSLGDDVSENRLKHYIAFKKVKNIACIDIRVRVKTIMLYLTVDVNSIKIEEGFTRDVTNIGKWGSGDLEITIKDMKDFEKAKFYINKAYSEN
jgi:predicted transport protein